MINNLPIYRAKKIDGDEYVKGYLVRADDYHTDVDEDQIIYFIMDKMENYRTTEVWDFVQSSRIDPTTLSIHFPDMLDSNGNKIFASLQKDGKGGDIVEYKGRQYTFGYKKEYFKVGLLNFRGWQLTTSDLLKVKTIGIQE